MSDTMELANVIGVLLCPLMSFVLPVALMMLSDSVHAAVDAFAKGGSDLGEVDLVWAGHVALNTINDPSLLYAGSNLTNSLDSMLD